jgi:hypothetical protein
MKDEGGRQMAGFGRLSEGRIANVEVRMSRVAGFGRFWPPVHGVPGWTLPVHCRFLPVFAGAGAKGKEQRARRRSERMKAEG